LQLIRKNTDIEKCRNLFFNFVFFGVLFRGVTMNRLEILRQHLYKEIEKGNKEDIIKASQKLDKVIFKYMQTYPTRKMKTEDT